MGGYDSVNCTMGTSCFWCRPLPKDESHGRCHLFYHPAICRTGRYGTDLYHLADYQIRRKTQQINNKALATSFFCMWVLYYLQMFHFHHVNLFNNWSNLTDSMTYCGIYSIFSPILYCILLQFVLSLCISKNYQVHFKCMRSWFLTFKYQIFNLGFRQSFI